MKQQEPLNTFPIQNFINQVKSAEKSRTTEVRLTLEQAKNLSHCLSLVMCRLNEDLEKLLLSQNKPDSENIEIQINNTHGW